jgi:hypothetical protein
MVLYRSGLMLRPPLALGGHCFVLAAPATALAPALHRCIRCLGLFARHEIDERRYRRCTGLARQLLARNPERASA